MNNVKGIHLIIGGIVAIALVISSFAVLARASGENRATAPISFPLSHAHKRLQHNPYAKATQPKNCIDHRAARNQSR